MSARSVKSTLDETAERIHNGVDAAEERLDENIDAFAARLASLEKQLRQTCDLLLKNAKELGGSASKHVQTHPLAAFGVAFLAGVTIAKLLRR